MSLPEESLIVAEWVCAVLLVAGAVGVVPGAEVRLGASHPGQVGLYPQPDANFKLIRRIVYT